MQVLADENISSRTVAALRELGLQVVAICETRSGIGDPILLELCIAQRTVLLTRDVELAGIAQSREIEGVVLLRLRQMPDHDVARRVAEVFEKADLIVGHFTIIGNNGVRHRVLNPV